jgi:type VI secretion system protein ImpK
MNLQVWQDLIGSHREACELVGAMTGEAAAADLDGIRPLLGGEAMDTLHGQLRQTLARVTAKLGPLVDSADIKQLVFVLAIALDEKVQRRLAPEEAPQWPLLQRALFDVHDGGDLFYDLVDDRIATHGTPEIIFELCYFCLSDGFVGRHSRNKPMIEEYKRKLAARISRPQGNETMDRTTAFMPSATATRIAPRYYLYSAGAALLVPLLLLLFW